MVPHAADDPGASWKYPGPAAPAGTAVADRRDEVCWRHPGPDPLPSEPQPVAHPTPAVAAAVGSGVFSVLAFVCAAVTAISCIVLIGPVGIVLGIVGHVRGERLGKWSAFAATAATVIAGAVLYFVVPDRRGHSVALS
ncbi:hypothetical protein [Nocardia stercoris]|uniref:DUF4190 domain-containing protein n=1 Tax=Nocardia stercoris TaxID=2483361 RepID=A0A3M2LJB9_9NOCA|nr:hypothetical protein [Nocardia stercoris]RMI34868.1 hypothetical protein EBN03_00360 [Nocardia stercoris]